MNDNLIMDPSVVTSLTSRDQAINFIREQIKRVRDEIARRPIPGTNEITSTDYVQWERKLMILHGRAMGSLQTLQAFGHLSIAEFKVLKREIIGAVVVKAADAQMGERRT